MVLTRIRTRNEYLLFFLGIFCAISLFGCAASNVSRSVTSNIDLGVQNAENLASNDGDIADTYQNMSQRTKGMLLGGAAGLITAGAFSTSVGVLPATAIGAIMGASYGSYIDANTTRGDELTNRGVTTAVVGDQVLIVIPSFRLFFTGSANIKPQAYSTLFLVTRYINNFTKILVRVSGYTDSTGAYEVDSGLSRIQAERVAKFLEESGVNTRLLYAEGCGGSKLVAPLGSGWQSDNYRIEITLEKLYV